MTSTKQPLQKIVEFNTPYIPKSIFDSIIKNTTIPHIAIEEKNSELWEYTYNGYGVVTLKDGSTIKTGAKFGILTIDPSNKDNKSCEINFSNGTKYTGEIKDNELQGKGTYIFPSGSTYTGDIKYGLRNGYGIYTSNDGITYEGEWVNGRKEGKGKIIKGDITFEGTFKNGLIDGYGKLYWNNGNSYEGEFKNNVINGNGTFVWIDSNEKYIGEWKDNKPDGLGMHIWYENDKMSKNLRNRYVGMWKGGKRDGYGVFFYSDGTKYEGFWTDDLKSGFGIYRFKNGMEYVGKFYFDRMINYNNEGIIDLKNENNEYFSGSNYQIDEKAKKKDFGFLSSNRSNNNKKKVTENVKQINKKLPSLEVIMENTPNNNNNNTNNKNNEQPLLILNDQKKKEEIPIQPSEIVPNVPREIKILKDEIYLASTRSIKESSINQYLSMIDITDILELQENFEQNYHQISNCLLRNIADLRRAYFHLLKINTEDPDFFFFNSRMQSASQAYDDLETDLNNINTNNNNNNNNEKDDKIGTCIELKDLWKFLRDYGIAGEDLTLAQFDRLFYHGSKNIEEMFTIPEELPKEKIYDYIYYMIHKSIRQFKYKNEYFYKFEQKEKEILNEHLNKKKNENNDNNNNNNINENLLGINNIKQKRSSIQARGSIISVLNFGFTQEENKNENNENFSLYFSESQEDPLFLQFDFHNHHNPILLSQFFEAIIRCAYLKYINLNISLEKKIELIISKFSIKRKETRRHKTNSSISSNTSRSKIGRKSTLKSENENNNNNNAKISNEQKQRNIEHVLIDNFINKFQFDLKPIFIKLFYKQKNLFDIQNRKENDMTITHKFLYENVILKSEFLKEFYENKENYIELISYYFKEKKISFKTFIEKYEYYQNLFNLEIIFYEFCEIIYISSTKYLISKMLNVEEDENYIKVFNHLNEVIENNQNLNLRKIIKNSKFKYNFPILKTHVQKQIIIDKNVEKIHQQLLRRFERNRFMKERKNMDLEKENAYVIYDEEEEEEEEESEDY